MLSAVGSLLVGSWAESGCGPSLVANRVAGEATADVGAAGQVEAGHLARVGDAHRWPVG